MTVLDSSPAEVARAFLAALDEQRWLDAVVLVDPRTSERFRDWWIARLGNRADEPEASDAETSFLPPLAFLGVADAAEAARLTAAEFLARFAEGVHPGNVLRPLPRGRADAGEEVRVTRTLLAVEEETDDRVTVRYRTEWWHGGRRNEATAGEHALELVRTADGWRVRDAELGGLGGGHILPPDG